MVKAGGIKVMKSLVQLYNMCLSQGVTLSKWDKAIIIHKKVNTTQLSNCRSISLLYLTIIYYKLFMKIITNRLTTKLDFYLPANRQDLEQGMEQMFIYKPSRH